MSRRAPRGPARQADQSQLGTNPRCVGYTGKTRCSATNTSFIENQWWCPRHAPDEGRPITGNCGHINTITVGNRTTCSWCARTIACLIHGVVV